MPRFEVATDTVAATGTELVDTGQALGSVRGGLQEALGLSGALDVAAGVFGQLCTVWARELTDVAAGTATQGMLTSAGADAYVTTDAGQMRAEGSE